MTATDVPGVTDGDAEQFLQQLVYGTPVMYGPTVELLTTSKLPPRTPLEERALAAVTDPVDLTVAQNRMSVVLESAKEMLEQTGSSPGAKWGDLNCALFTAEGVIAVSSSSGVNVFSACASPPVQFIAKNWIDEPSVGVHPGDVFYYNDARYGGVHNADQTLFMPIFHGQTLIAWAGVTVHEGENGATEPGGMAATSKSVYDDGLKISPMKIAENYILKRDIVNLFQNNSRDPLLQLADTRAKLAAARRIEQQLTEFMKDKGELVVVASMRRALETTQAELHRRLAELPDGVYRAVHFLDTTLLEDRMVKSAIALHKRGENLRITTKGTAPMFRDRGINAMPPFTRSLMAGVLFHYFWSDAGKNAGHSAALDFEIEADTVAFGDFEVPNGLCMVTATAWHTLMHQCMSKMVYNNPGDVEIVAPWYGTVQAMVYGGLNQWGLPQGNLMIDINAQGGGAHANRDGEHAVSPFFAAMADYGEIEERETELPILALGRNLLVNNHGFGRQRGGSSVECMYMVWGVEEWFFACVGAGSRFPNQPGLFGGYGGPSTPLSVFRADSPEAVKTAFRENGPEVPYTAHVLHSKGGLPGRVESMRATQPATANAEGDMWILQCGGGGGYGDILQRDPQQVIDDLEGGHITEWVAESVYRVVWDPETMTVDVEATAAARAAERADRLRRGKPYDEFVAEWRRDSPPENIEYYGSWSWEEPPA